MSSRERKLKLTPLRVSNSKSVWNQAQTIICDVAGLEELVRQSKPTKAQVLEFKRK